ncbi:MAG: TonB-dependent receptor [Acidobacteria bacterium]|nr:TonB-dependent receptor [Acidobacteriota bacterium]
MMSRRTEHAKSIFVLTFVLFTAAALGQATTAQISGVVRDETAAVLPGVTVIVRNVDTNVERTVISDEEGRYRALDLAPGAYEVRAELSGFKTGVRTGIALTIGREAAVDFTLTVGELAEKVTVSGDAPLVETTTSSMGGLVNQDQIRDLPLNGRSFQDLLGLQMGVVLPTKTTSQPSQGVGKKFSVGGARISFNQFLVDGGEINDARDSTPASVAGLTMGVEAVREFKVLTNSYSAEFGRSAGAVITVVTKSGTNRLHGSVYEYHRNSALDARNFFTPGGSLPFKRNQFGVGVDGPIWKDHTFFMFNYEGLRQRLETPASFLTLDANARLGILPGRPAITVDSRIRPFVNLFPLPTPGGRNFGNGAAEYLIAQRYPINEDYGTIRIDHQFSQATSLFGRYTFDNGKADIINQSYNLFKEADATNSKTAVFEVRRVFTPSLINTGLFSFNYPSSTQEGLRIGSFSPSATIGNRSLFGNIRVSGLSGFGQSEFQNQWRKTFDIVDNVLYARGRHSLKFGGVLKRMSYRDNSTATFGGRWDFGSIEDFLLDRPQQLEVVAPGSDPERNLRQKLVGFYLQDDFQMRTNLTFNLGLRYEFITVPVERDGKMANLRSLTDAKLTIGEPLFKNPSLRNFAPRFGFAWDLFGNGKTALRGGFGIFHGQLLPRFYEVPLRRTPPFFTTALITSPSPLPLDESQASGLRSLPVTDVQVTPFEFEPHSTYMMQYNLSLQREVLPDTVLTMAYVGSRGIHLPRKVNWNIATAEIRDGRKFFAANLRRRNPNFGQITAVTMDSNSVYNSLQLGLMRRLTQGFRFQANYTFSRSIDTASDVPENTYGGSIYRPQDPDQRNDARGLSDFHIQHSFAFNSSYKLPWGSGLPGLARAVAGGWEISGIVSMASGSPFGAELGFDRARSLEIQGQRPNLKPGFGNNPILGGPGQYFDVNAFELQPAGFFGNLGRHTMIGPSLASVDFSAIKEFPVPSVSEEFRVQLRAEFFNIGNHANFASPRRSGTGGVQPINSRAQALPSAAQLTSTATTSRQIQLALKVIF